MIKNISAWISIWNVGIGRDLCERLDKLGAIVYAISRSAEPLAELKAAHPRVETIHLDVSDWSNTRTQLQKHMKDVKIDGLVNNAAISISKSVYEFDEEDFDTYVCCRCCCCAIQNSRVEMVFFIYQTLGFSMSMSKQCSMLRKRYCRIWRMVVALWICQV